uniref:Retrotransposon gag domain-containing protein n=1 Tax=Tanacetum cinerariifolium TaxID=118510 RepID=A0A699H0R4_TANCI|nr:hypothetical protein [Tanacetum cinerariifolium]
MVNLEFCDVHNMVAYLEKPEGIEGFHQTVDFLKASHIRVLALVQPRWENDPGKLGTASDLLRSKQPFILEESPVDTMADQRTMAELLRAPTEGYAEAIMVPPILADQFKLKHSLINMMTTDQFFGLEKDNPYDHIHWFNKITSVGAARRWLEKEPTRSIHTWEDLVSKFINEFFPPSRTTNLRNEISNFQQRFDESFHEAWDRYKDLLRAFPHHGFNELHQLDTFYSVLNPADQDSLNAAAGGNLLERRTQDVLMIIKNKSKVRNSQNKAIVSQVKSCDANSNSSSEIAKLTHAVNQQTSACLAAGGNTFPELRDNIQGYVSAAVVNYNQGNSVYRPPGMANQIRPPSFAQPNVQNNQNRGRVLDEPTVPTPPPFINLKEDERVEEILTDPDLSEYTIKVPPPHKMLKALLSNKEKLQELANTPLNENCSAVILKKLPEKLRDPRKFLIPCGFSLPELISTRMTLKLANQAICTPARIARDVFVLVGKFTFPANFVIVDYESDPRVPLILGRPFLRTARALINVHAEEMILRDGYKRLTLNIRHDTSSYSNQPQKESINLINVFNYSSEDFLEDLFSNQPSGNPTFLSHHELTSPEFKNDTFNLEGGNVLPKKLLDLDSTKDLHPFHLNPLIGKIEFLLHQDIGSSLKDSIYQSNLANLADNFVDSMPEMFTDEHALDYSSPPIFDEYDDDFLEVESETKNVYDDPFDSKGEKIKESKLLIDELDLPCDFPSFEYDSFISQDFSGLMLSPQPTKPRVIQDKKLATSNASLVFEDFDPPFYEPFFFKEVPKANMLLPFSSKNEEKVFKPGIHTSKKTKKVYGAAYTTLIKKVKKLVQNDKLSMPRRKLRLVLSDEKALDTNNLAPEDPSKQGRKITQFDEDEGITLVQMGAQTQWRQQEQERLGLEAAVKLQEELDEEERQGLPEYMTRLDLLLRKNGLEQDLKLMKVTSEATDRGKRKKRISLVPDSSQAAVREAEGTKIAAEEELGHQSSKKQKLDELSQEELQQLMIIVPKEGMNIEDMLKTFDRDDLVKLWSLVQERFNLINQQCNTPKMGPSEIWSPGRVTS